jgi:hypothetical protein
LPERIGTRSGTVESPPYSSVPSQSSRCSSSGRSAAAMDWQAWLEVMDLLGALTGQKTEFFLVGLAILTPFSGLGAARIGFTRRGSTSVLFQIGVAILGGVVTTVFLSKLNIEFFSFWKFVTFGGGAGAAAIGMALGDPLERWLLKVLRGSADH